MVLLAGVEEAGRGPVIGPMVMCGVVINEKDSDKLRSIGAKDSKLLTPKTRELLFDQITSMVERYEVVVISPKEIDKYVMSSALNLNWLEAIKSAELINKLMPDKVILDCPSNNDKSYVAYVRKYVIKKSIKLVAEHKADLTYPVVSAASIIAKVVRDREIEELKKKHKVNFGSGYPSDPITIEFLKKNWKKYDFFRKSWATYKQFAEEEKQKSLGEF